jgi:uncharacterized protein (TIGR00255 family)
MTGFGEGHRQIDGLHVAVEIRTINSRFYKLTVRLPDSYSVLESQIDAVVRKTIRRGTVQVSLRFDRGHSADDYLINPVALASYRRQLEELSKEWHQVELFSMHHLLQLPGVVDETSDTAVDIEKEWPVIKEALNEAVKGLLRMRRKEGQAMTTDLQENLDGIAVELEAVDQRSPHVIDGYRSRLEDRLNKVLAEYEVSLDPSDLIKELALYAERSDVSEEIVRLRSHLKQFAETLLLTDGVGRKLEFVTQEMNRETNTIGSKANDVEISRRVVEIKARLERIREMIQNIE